MQRWQDWANLVLGVWLILSPWLLGFSGTPAAMWNAVLVGVVVGLMALMHLRGGPMWEEWVSVVLGVWLILSPWILGFSGMGNAMWNAVIVGLLVGALALSVTREKPKAA
ncbi:SPW repeat protein [Thermus altitudinis]|uniref:SPW repeat protein n=1 Tax=Thermus altitudinis TaxID=2908145 RepID=UPI001FA94CDA|nr:SPW repeat protein [Thermus altitudinis]